MKVKRHIGRLARQRKESRVSWQETRFVVFCAGWVFAGMEIVGRIAASSNLLIRGLLS